MPIARRFAAVATVLIAVAIGAAPAAADRQQRVQRLQKVLDHLVDLKGGPPGASAVLLRGDRERLVRAGVADVDTGKPFTAPQARTCGSPASRKRSAARSRSRSSTTASSRSRTRSGSLAAASAGGLARGHPARPAQPHQRPAGFLRQQGLRRVLRRPFARRHRDARAGRLRPRRAARFPGRERVPLFEHRQHRRRADGRGRHRDRLPHPASARGRGRSA